jgi:hypothetical protein
MNKPSFAYRAQIVLLLLLLLSFVFMTQTASQLVFQIGAVMLIVCAIAQIAVGNINISFNAKKWLFAFLKILAIIATVFGVSILLVPLFLNNDFIKIFLIALIAGVAAIFGIFIAIGTKEKSRKKRG